MGFFFDRSRPASDLTEELASEPARSLGPIPFTPWLPLLGLAMALGLFLSGLSSIPLFDPDEGRYAEISREMIVTGDYLAPRQNGVLYFDKPPLYYWLTALSIRTFGLSEVTARLWSMLAGLAGLGLAFSLGRALAGPGLGVVAALMLGTAPLYLGLAHVSSIDMTVSVLLGACLTCFWHAYRTPAGRRRSMFWMGMFLTSGLAVLAKGLIGIVIPGGAVFLCLLVSGEWTLLRAVPWLRGVLLFLLVTVPWHLAVSLEHPSFPWYYFVHEHFLRYATMEANHYQPWWFFLPVLVLGLLPWAGFLPSAALLLRKGRARVSERRLVQFCWCWALWVVLFFSPSRSKLVPYVLPAFVPLAVLAAAGLRATLLRLDRGVERAGRVGWALSAGALMLLGLAVAWVASGASPHVLPAGTVPAAVPVVAGAAALVALIAGNTDPRRAPRMLQVSGFVAACGLMAALMTAGPYVGARRSARGVAEYLAPRLGSDASLFTFRIYPRSLSAYLGRLVGVVDYRGELAFGIDQLPADERRRRFPTAAEFRARWESDEPIYLVTNERYVVGLTPAGLTSRRVAFRAGKLIVLTNRALTDPKGR